MTAFLRFLMLLSLAAWLGGILFFGAVMAPALFSILPSRHLAGTVVVVTLTRLHWIGLAAAAVFLVCSVLATRKFAWRDGLVAAMLALTLISEFGIARKMQALRNDMVNIDAIAQTDARRVDFNRLHRVSTGLEQAVLVMGLVVLWTVAREPSPR